MSKGFTFAHQILSFAGVYHTSASSSIHYSGLRVLVLVLLDKFFFMTLLCHFLHNSTIFFSLLINRVPVLLLLMGFFNHLVSLVFQGLLGFRLYSSPLLGRLPEVSCLQVRLFLFLQLTVFYIASLHLWGVGGLFSAGFLHPLQ